MIEFHDREKEIEDITRIINYRPDLITRLWADKFGKNRAFPARYKNAI